MQRLELVGTTFGRLTVISYEGKRNSGQHTWKCNCTCGAQTVTTTLMLRTGKKRSCGCLRKETAAVHARSLSTHGAWTGGKSTREWATWANMRSRCSLVTHPQYSEYGGRGITIDPAWEDFSTFLADMGPRPSNKHSLDRVNNDLGYSRENCRWATRIEQNNNTRFNHRVTVNGLTMTIAQWARALNVTRNELKSQGKKSGSLEKAIQDLIKPGGQ